MNPKIREALELCSDSGDGYGDAASEALTQLKDCVIVPRAELERISELLYLGSEVEAQQAIDAILKQGEHK